MSTAAETDEHLLAVKMFKKCIKRIRAQKKCERLLAAKKFKKRMKRIKKCENYLQMLASCEHFSNAEKNISGHGDDLKGCLVYRAEPHIHDSHEVSEAKKKTISPKKITWHKSVIFHDRELKISPELTNVTSVDGNTNATRCKVPICDLLIISRQLSYEENISQIPRKKFRSKSSRLSRKSFNKRINLSDIEICDLAFLRENYCKSRIGRMQKKKLLQRHSI